MTDNHFFLVKSNQFLPLPWLTFTCPVPSSSTRFSSSWFLHWDSTRASLVCANSSSNLLSRCSDEREERWWVGSNSAGSAGLPSWAYSWRKLSRLDNDCDRTRNDVLNLDGQEADWPSIHQSWSEFGWPFHTISNILALGALVQIKKTLPHQILNSFVVVSNDGRFSQTFVSES